MPRMRTAPVILALFVVAGANASRDARAEDCLSGPNGASPAGKHWYYRIDRATHRHCWYLGALDGRRHRVASARPAASASRRAEAMPAEPDAAEPAPPAASAAPPAASAAPPQPAFGTRWSDDAPRVVADGAQPPAPVAAASPPPDRMVTRSVPVERIAREPAPPKPPEAVTVRLAAAASPPAPVAEKHGAVPAALFGVALLLAVLGIILVRARRRIIVRVTDEPAADSPALAPGRDEHVRGLFMRIRSPRRTVVATRRTDREQELARRSMHQILADAAWDEESPDAAFLAQAVGSTAAADIAAATLQPAIDPLPPEPIAPAADVEQSLRQLLADWERRAA